MKKTMKKITAGMVALLMAVQLAPALGATYSSGTIVGSPEGYKEELEIVASKGTVVLMGQTLQLDVNEDYTVTWTSGNPAVATVDEDGLVTAVADGTATVTAQAGRQMDSVDITVIDPEPILQEVNAEMEQEQPAEGPAEEPAEEPADEPAGEPEAQAPAAKRAMVIVINGENENTVYNGEEHVLDRYVATSNDDEFDPEKVKVSGDLGVKATNCGTYILDLENTEFTYDDPNVAARFVVNNSFLKITPAPVTVTANEASKEEGQADPELTATVTGLLGEDTIEYTLTREPGETLGEYVIEASGEEQQGNYRVEYLPGRLLITGDPVVTVEINIPEGQAVYLGTEIALTAVPAGFGDAELTYQWEYSADGETWAAIPGATEPVYRYELTRDNVAFEYRVSVEPVQ